MPRLFVAVWPPDDVVRELTEMPRLAIDSLRWTKPERLHITLRFLGECNEAEAAAALRLSSHAPEAAPTLQPESHAPARVALRPVSHTPVRVTLGPALDLLGRGVVILPARGVDELAAAVTAATADIGQPPPKRRFTGHMTVARFKRDPAPDEWPLAGAPTPKTSFTASEIALVRVEPSGAYANLERFKLS